MSTPSNRPLDCLSILFSKALLEYIMFDCYSEANGLQKAGAYFYAILDTHTHSTANRVYANADAEH